MNLDKLIELLKAIGPICNLEKPTKDDLIGTRVLVRTYSAGVHIGTLVSRNGMECRLRDALRLWCWNNGGLSLSAIAPNGMKGGRINRTPQVDLTNAVEYTPVTEKAWASYANYIEDFE